MTGDLVIGYALPEEYRHAIERWEELIGLSPRFDVFGQLKRDAKPGSLIQIMPRLGSHCYREQTQWVVAHSPFMKQKPYLPGRPLQLRVVCYNKNSVDLVNPAFVSENAIPPRARIHWHRNAIGYFGRVNE